MKILIILSFLFSSKIYTQATSWSYPPTKNSNTDSINSTITIPLRIDLHECLNTEKDSINFSLIITQFQNIVSNERSSSYELSINENDSYEVLVSSAKIDFINQNEFNLNIDFVTPYKNSCQDNKYTSKVTLLINNEK